MSGLQPAERLGLGRWLDLERPCQYQSFGLGRIERVHRRRGFDQRDRGLRIGSRGAKARRLRHGGRHAEAGIEED
jgi:hypothetical protein